MSLASLAFLRAGRIWTVDGLVACTSFQSLLPRDMPQTR
jgi:hypothetical protein